MPKRKDLLNTAIALTCGSREAEYGSPAVNLQDTANLWTAYVAMYCPDAGIEFSAEDVAWMNTLQKMSRAASGTAGDDTYVDAAAYAAIAGEVR